MNYIVSNYQGGDVEFLLTGTDAEGRVCLYDFKLFIPSCIEEQNVVRSFQEKTNDYSTPTELYLSPNPTQDLVTIHYNGYKENLSYAVYDLAGRLMTNGELSVNENNHLVKTESYPTGVYVVVVKRNNLFFAQYKLIKK
ncbi:MAG: T9SS type A sorting domain-containing protein [Flavobacteriales bacterium]|nr:T9SS type A sorting domain-containing protein [Flavobacteriales bacterium]